MVLHVAARAQEICRALGAPILIAAARVKDIVKAYYAPGAPDAVYQGAAKVNCRETAETMYRRKPQVERLWKVDGGRMGGERTFPSTFAPI